MTQILAVDDSKSMLQMVTYTLENAGFDVVNAEDGAAGLEKAKNVTADLIITDVNMPIMDGITLVKKLRELPKYQYIPILILTTESTQEKKMQGKNAGASGWIVKPFNPEQMIKTIEKLLG